MKYINYDKIAEEAARKYPIGTKYYPLNSSGVKGGYIETAINKPNWISTRSRLGQGRDSLDVGYGYIYVDEIWAEVVSLPKNYKFLNEPSYEVY